MTTIYLDMDGVVADWCRGAARAILTPDQTPDKISDADWGWSCPPPRFFRDLQKMPAADQLVDWVWNWSCRHGAQVRFLTAIPVSSHMPWAITDKVMWAHQHWPQIPVFFGPFSGDKWRHAEPGDILIDDRAENIEQWTAAGGRGHLYTSWPTAKEWLIGQLAPLK